MVWGKCFTKAHRSFGRCSRKQGRWAMAKRTLARALSTWCAMEGSPKNLRMAEDHVANFRRSVKPLFSRASIIVSIKRESVKMCATSPRSVSSTEPKTRAVKTYEWADSRHLPVLGCGSVGNQVAVWGLQPVVHRLHSYCKLLVNKAERAPIIRCCCRPCSEERIAPCADSAVP